MRLSLARVLSLWIAAMLAVLVQPVRPARATEHAGVEAGQTVELTANTPRRSILSERGLERGGDVADGDELAWLATERPWLSSTQQEGPTRELAVRTGRPFRSIETARGPPRC